MVALGKPRSDVISTFTMTNTLVPRISESAVRQFETVNFLHIVQHMSAGQIQRVAFEYMVSFAGPMFLILSVCYVQGPP